MTFREKFHEEFPKSKGINPALKWCPSAFDYEADWTCDPKDLNSEEPDCDKCWNREIPDQEQEPKFIIEIEPIARSGDSEKRDKEPIQDNNMEIRDFIDKKAREYLERLFNLGKDKDQDIIDVRSKGLSGEEKVILMDAMERALRRIRHQRRKGEHQQYVLLCTRLD